MGKAFIFGTFNPCHNVHVEMGIMTKHVLGNNYDVIYIPTSDEYIRSWKGYKEGSVLPGDIRIKLLQDAVCEHGFDVSSVEIMGLTDGRTYNTINYFGFDDSVLCLGMDNIIQMKKWYRYEELLEKVKLLIFKRKGYADGQMAYSEEALSQSAEVMEILKHSCGYKICKSENPSGISSTEVRKLYMERNIDRRSMDKLKELVPVNVFKYLEENEDVYF